MLREVWNHIRSLFKSLFTGFISFWVIFGVLLKPIGPLVAVLVALGAAFVSAIIAVLVPKISKKCAAQLALWVITRAAKSYSIEVEAEGIGEKEGSLVVGIATGSSEGTRRGDKFLVLNSATDDEWGVLEVLEADENSCVCRVSNRINREFWDELESKIRTNPSFPRGLSISRNLPEGILDFVQRLVRDWGG